jgi:NAD(P)H-hydrate epimerase
MPKRTSPSRSGNAKRAAPRPIEPPPLPARASDAHKGSFGHVLLLAGSWRYPGAAVLSARSALRVGCGLVTLGCPENVRASIASQLLCEMSLPLPGAAPGVFSPDAVSEALDLAEHCESAGLGPGLSNEAPAQAFARDIALLVPVPLVIDADGLNALHGHVDDLARAEAVRVLTPHPGEAARLLGAGIAEVTADRRGAVLELAKKSHAIVVLKGAGTLVTDGERVYVNGTGNSGMATAGSGDVLTGVIASLLAQGMEPFDGAVLGVHLHGLAGDLAAADLGQHGMIASDILDRLPAACLAHGRKSGRRLRK